MIHDTTKCVRMLLHNFIFSLNCIVVPRRLQIGLLELRRFLECDNKSRWRTRRDRRKEGGKRREETVSCAFSPVPPQCSGQVCRRRACTLSLGFHGFHSYHVGGERGKFFTRKENIGPTVQDIPSLSMCFSLCAVDAMHLPHPSALTPNSKQKGIRREREGNSFPPPAHPFPLSWIPTILRRAHQWVGVH